MLTGIALWVVMQRSPDPLKVISYNIRYGTAQDGPNRWELRRSSLLKLVKREAPALLAVQEALEAQVDEMREALGFQPIGVGREDGRAKGEFAAILFDPQRLRALKSDTFWLSETPSKPNSTTWGNRVTRVCSWAFFQDLHTKRYFYCYNLHLDHESQLSREKGVDLVLQSIAARATDDPVLLTGDFNVGETNSVIANVKRASFRDTYRVLYPDEKLVGTFSGFKDLGLEKIDYIFSDPRWEVKTAKILTEKIDGRWPSDHAPVSAELLPFG